MYNVWFALLDDPEFLKELSAQGHSTERNFSEYKTSHNLKVSSLTPNYLSIDFYSGQSKELRDKNCFIIKTGKGNFTIFDENRFEKPYLDLDLSIAEELDYEIPKNFEHLDEGGIYVASIPELPGCHTQAETIDKLNRRIKESTELYLEVEPEK